MWTHRILSHVVLHLMYCCTNTASASAILSVAWYCNEWIRGRPFMRYMFLLEKSILMSASEKNPWMYRGRWHGACWSHWRLLSSSYVIPDYTTLLQACDLNNQRQSPSHRSATSCIHSCLRGHLNSLGQYKLDTPKVFAQEFQLIMLTQQENLTSL